MLTPDRRPGLQSTPPVDEQYLGVEMPDEIGRQNEWYPWIEGKPLIVAKAVEVTQLLPRPNDQVTRIFYHKNSPAVLVLRRVRDIMPNSSPTLIDDLSEQTLIPENDRVRWVATTSGVNPETIIGMLRANAPQAKAQTRF